MAGAITADFELGVNGNAIATSDAGSVTPWDTTNNGTGATFTYDNTHAYGSLSAKCATGGTAAGAELRWNTAFQNNVANSLNHYARLYVYRTANPAASAGLFGPRLSTGGSSCGDARITSAGKIELRQTDGTVKATSTNAITLNAWVRLEFHWIISTTVGQIECLIFNSPDSTAATETVTTAATINTGATCGEVRFGLLNNLASQTFWMDNFWAAGSFYPGPASIPHKQYKYLQAVQRAASW